MAWAALFTLALLPGACSQNTEPTPMNNAELATAVVDWMTDSSLAEATYGDIAGWITTEVTAIDWLFHNARAFNSDIGRWDMSRVTSMYQTFAGSSAFNQDVGDWDTSRVTNMEWMFLKAAAFNQDLGGWDTSRVTSMYEMFTNAVSFDQYVGGWDTSRVTSMHGIFRSCSVFNQDIGGWDMSEVTSIEEIFLEAAVFNQDLGGWDTSGVTSMVGVFASATAFNQHVDGWDTSKVTSMYELFSKATAFNQDVGGWDTSKVTTMEWSFFGSTAFNQDVSGWDLSRVAVVDEMFSQAAAFNQDVGGWDMSKVTTMNGLFEKASAFNQDVNGWNTSGVTSMDRMFLEAAAFNQDVGSWDTSGVTSMEDTFSAAVAFNQDINGWDTSHVSTVEKMFNDAKSFNRDLDHWDLSSVSTLSFMFFGAEVFNQSLAWCLPLTVNTHSAFDLTLCQKTFCGVTQIDGACPTASPTVLPPVERVRRHSSSSSSSSWGSSSALVSSAWGRFLVSVTLALSLIAAALVARRAKQRKERRALEDHASSVVYAPLLPAQQQPAADGSSPSSIVEMASVLGKSNLLQLQDLIMMVIQLDNDFNVLQWSRGVANVTGRESPPPGLKFSGLGFRGEADRALADYEVTRVLRSGCAPRPFPLWLRAADNGLRFVAIVAQCVRSYEKSWLIFGNEVEAAMLSLMHRAPTVVGSSSGYEEPDQEEDEYEVDVNELWDSVSDRSSHVTKGPESSRLLPSRAEPRPDEYAEEDGLKRGATSKTFTTRIQRDSSPDVYEDERGRRDDPDTSDELFLPACEPPRESSRLTEWCSNGKVCSDVASAEHPTPRRAFGYVLDARERVSLLRVDRTGALSGPCFVPRHAHGALLLDLDSMAKSVDSPPPPGVYTFAVASGESHVRALFGENDEPHVFGSGAAWHRVIGAHDDEARELATLRDLTNVAGGQLEIGAHGVLLRWCVTSYTWHLGGGDSGESLILGGETLKQTLGSGRHVPLPLDRLWVACERSDPSLREAISSEPNVLQELHTSGRLEFVSQSTIAWKATTLLEPTFAYTAECVASAQNALESFQTAQLELRAASRTRPGADSSRNRHREVALAQEVYASARANMQAVDALQTLTDGRREREALAKLGLVDGRRERHNARVRVLNGVLIDPHCMIYSLPHEAYKIIMCFVASTDDESQISPWVHSCS